MDFDPRDHDSRDEARFGPDRDRDAHERDVDPRDVFTRDVNLPSGLDREIVRDRDREYTLRGSESRTLATVGAFRVVSTRDLRDHHDRPADPRSGDLRHLRAQGLVEPVRVPGSRDHAVALTKAGRSLLESHRDRDREGGQSFYAGVKRERELAHDVQVYRAYAVESDCVHNRARLYRLRSKRLYYAIGEPNSRYRRPVPARGALERLMLLDAVLASPDLDWLASESEQAGFVVTLGASDPIHASPHAEVRASSESRSTFSGTYPIGLDPSGRAVLLYLATVPWIEEFRRFLQPRAALLRVVPGWTLRLVFPRPVDRAYEAYRTVIREELETPLPSIAEALAAGTARVECVVLPHAYRHLAPVVDHDHSAAREVAKGLRSGTREGTRPPHALNPGPQPRRVESELGVSEQLERDWHALNETYNAQKNLGLTPRAARHVGRRSVPPPRQRFRVVQTRNRDVNDPGWRARGRPRARSGVVHVSVSSAPPQVVDAGRPSD